PSPEAVERICAAVDMACIWYWKEALCLQRSAAAAGLLKRYGVPAQMVIGALQMPFEARAWVEVDGLVVNDKPYTPELYGVLVRWLEPNRSRKVMNDERAVWKMEFLRPTSWP